MNNDVSIQVKAVDQASKVLNDVNNNLKNLSGGMKEVQKSQESMAMSIFKGLGYYDLTKTAIQAVGRAFLGMLNESRQFETAFTGVVKTFSSLDGNAKTTAEELIKVKEGIIQMSQVMPRSASEIAKVSEIAGQLGVKGSANLLEFTKTIVQLSDTTNIVGEEGALQLAKVLNVMQIAPSEAGRFGSSLVSLGNNFSTTEADILTFANRLSGIAKVIGMSAPAMLGLSAAMSSLGIEAEMGGTAMMKVFSDMMTAVKSGGKELQNFANISGVSANSFADSFKKAPEQAFAIFVKGLNTMNTAGGDVIKTLDKMGISDIRTQLLLLKSALAHQLVVDSLKNSGKAYDENTARQKEAEIRYKTFDSQVQILVNNIMNLARVGGDLIKNFLAPIVLKLNEVGIATINFIKNNKDLLKTLLDISIILITMATVYITVGKAVGLYKTITLAMETATKGLTIAQTLLAFGIKAVNAAMLLITANPLGAFLMAVAGVIMFLILRLGGLGNTINVLSQIYSIAFNAILYGAKIVGNFFVEWINKKISTYTTAYNAFTIIANKMGGNFKKIEAIKIKPFNPSINLKNMTDGQEKLKNILKDIEKQQAIKKAPEEFKSPETKKLEEETKKLEEELKKLKSTADNTARGITEGGNKAKDSVDKIANAVENATTKFTDLKDKATIQIADLGEKLKELEQNNLDKVQEMNDKKLELDNNYVENKKKLTESLASKEQDLINLESKHKESIASINQSITEQQNKSTEATKSYQKAMSDIAKQTLDTQKKIKDLQTSFATGETGDKTSVAEKVYQQQQEAEKLRKEIAKATKKDEIESVKQRLQTLKDTGKDEIAKGVDIQAQIAGATLQLHALQNESTNAQSDETIATKEKELAKIEADLQANASFITGIQAQVDEVKRVNSLGEIARAVEEYNTKRTLALQEYTEKKAMLDQELVDLGTKRAEETTQYNNKLLEIQGEITQLNIKRVSELANYNAKRIETQSEITDIKAKILANDEEYKAKSANILKEITDLQNSYIQKKADYEAQQLAITDILAQAEKVRADNQANTSAKNIANIQKEIDKYNELAKAMSMTGSATGRSIASTKGKQFGGYVDKPKMYAFGGLVTGDTGIDKVPAMLSAGEIVLNASQQRNVASNIQSGGGKSVVINIGGNFYGNDKEFANKIGDQIMKEFIKHTAFESF